MLKPTYKRFSNLLIIAELSNAGAWQIAYERRASARFPRIRHIVGPFVDCSNPSIFNLSKPISRDKLI